VQLQDHMQSGLQEEFWRSAESWLTSISASMELEGQGQRALQECCRSVQRWLTSISAITKLEQPGQRCLQ
jgi:hypothetical protein